MNSSFSTLTPSLQLAWDATSIELLKTCPRKYALSMLSGYTTGEDNVHLHFGTLYHEALCLYEKWKWNGSSPDEALIFTVQFIMKATWNHQLNRPWASGHPNKNRFTLVRSVVWHILTYKDDPAKTLIIDERPAVELSFQFQSSFTTSQGEPYLICGHLDRVVEMGGLNFGLDYKTTKYAISGEDFFQFYSPDNQMTLYSFAGRIIYNSQIRGMVIDAAQIMVGFTRFKRGFANRTEAQIEEWYQELGQHWLPLAEHYAKLQRWPMNDTACGRYGGCPFRGICGKDPRVRNEWLAAGFKRRTWDPLKVRGDI